MKIRKGKDMTEQEIKNMAVKAAEEKGFKVTRNGGGYYELETESEIITVGTTTHAKATVNINRYKKDGWHRTPTAHQLIKIGCKSNTAERKINLII